MQDPEAQIAPRIEAMALTRWLQALGKLTKKHRTLLIKLGMALVIMIVLVRSLSYKEIFLSLNQAKIHMILLASILLVPNIYVQLGKWRFLVRRIKPGVTFSEIFNSLLIGFTLGFITPGRLGDIGRAFFIKDTPWQRTLGLAVIDKIYAAGVVYIGGITSLLYIGHKFLNLYLYVPAALLGLAVIGLVLYILLHPQTLRSIFYMLNIILPRREKIKIFISSLDNFESRQGLTLLAWSLLFSFVYLTQFYCITLAFAYVAPLKAYAAATATFLVKTLLPISFGDLGIREGAAVVFFKTVGVEGAVALNASLVLFGINLVTPSLFGLIIVLKNKLFTTFFSARSNGTV